MLNFLVLTVKKKSQKKQVMFIFGGINFNILIQYIQNIIISMCKQ